MPAGGLRVSGTAEEQREKLVSARLHESLHERLGFHLEDVAFILFLSRVSCPSMSEASVQELRSGRAFSAVTRSILSAGLHPAL